MTDTSRADGSGTGSSVEVRQVDPRGPDLARWAGVLQASRTADRPDDPPTPVEQERAAALAGLPERDPSEVVVLLLALDGDRPVGAARLDLPQRDNLHAAHAQVAVDPAARRRGTGTRLLAAVQQAAQGRDLLTAELDEPPAQAGTSPGRRFLERAGFALALTEVRRDLALPVPEPLLGALEGEAREHAAGYRVVSWRDRCPDALVEARAGLGRVMSLDAPLGELELGEESWDVARVRERERALGEQGRTSVVAGAVHEASGALVAFSELAADPARPELVEQWETLVLGGHRGHRLGLLVKAAALRRLAQEVPGARRVHTFNAESNGPMIAVNALLGFVPHGTLTLWQRRTAR